MLEHPLDTLNALLDYIARHDPSNPAVGGSDDVPAATLAYTARNGCIAAATLCAEGLGMHCWIAPDTDEPDEWIVVGIELPSGQVTWHLPAGYRRPLEVTCYDEKPSRWDGHTTEQKYERIAAFLSAQTAGADR